MNPLNKYGQAMASQNVRMMLQESVPRLPRPVDPPTPSIGDFYAYCDHFTKCNTNKLIKIDHHYGYYPKANLTKLGKNIHESVMFALYSPVAHLHTQGLILLSPLSSLVLSKIQEHALPQINIYDPPNEPRFNNFIADIHYTAMQGNIRKQEKTGRLDKRLRLPISIFGSSLYLNSLEVSILKHMTSKNLMRYIQNHQKIVFFLKYTLNLS